MSDAAPILTPERRRPGRPKGQPKTGGRRKGSKNKITRQRASEIAKSGLTPLEYMLKILRSKISNDDDKKWAAEKAAPYCHHRLSTTELTGKEGEPFQLIITGLPS